MRHSGEKKDEKTGEETDKFRAEAALDRAKEQLAQKLGEFFALILR